MDMEDEGGPFIIPDYHNSHPPVLPSEHKTRRARDGVVNGPMGTSYAPRCFVFVSD
jgi:hypothetical protein